MGAFLRQLPNALSLSRIPAAVVFLLVYSNTSPAAMGPGLAVLAYALVSDFLDGYIARTFVGASTTGYFLDGLGDRAISIAILLTVVRIEPSQSVLAWALIFREIAIYALRALDTDNLGVLTKLRPISVLQALLIRLYFGGFFVAEAMRATGMEEISVLRAYVLLGVATAIVGYTGLVIHTVILVRTSDGQQ